MQQKIYSMLINEDEVTWQQVLHDLVRKEEMDPWDIDISSFTAQYIRQVKELKEHNFRISGKVILAAAILLKLKSNKFVGEDMLELDRLINSLEEEEQYYEELSDDFRTPGLITDQEKYKLIPRTPSARKRKVSIYDLMEALEQALEVRRRKVLREMPDPDLKIPDKSVDISVRMRFIYSRIKSFILRNGSILTFRQLIPSESKEDKVATFIPLLHLSNMRKVDLNQEEAFGEIRIALLHNRASSRDDIAKELSA